MDDEAVWKRRFLVFSAIRAAGLALFLLGMGVGVADWLRPGGGPPARVAGMLLGLAQAVLAPPVV